MLSRHGEDKLICWIAVCFYCAGPRDVPSRGYGPVMATRQAASKPAAESQMIVVTPTYAPDFELFTDLHQSVLRCFPADVRHVVIAPERDLSLFRQFSGPRCVVLEVRDVLPRSVLALPF